MSRFSIFFFLMFSTFIHKMMEDVEISGSSTSFDHQKKTSVAKSSCHPVRWPGPARQGAPPAAPGCSMWAMGIVQAQYSWNRLKYAEIYWDTTYPRSVGSLQNLQVGMWFQTSANDSCRMYVLIIQDMGIWFTNDTWFFSPLEVVGTLEDLNVLKIFLRCWYKFNTLWCYSTWSVSRTLYDWYWT